MSVSDRWHRREPAEPGQEKCRCGTRERPYPTADHGKSQRWAVRWREVSGQQRKRLFARLPDAQRYAAEVRGQMDSGRYLDPDAGKATVRDVAERWRAAVAVGQRPATRGNTERTLRNHIYPLLGEREISTVRRADIERWVADRSQVLAPSSLDTAYGVLRSVFAWATGEYITTDPCAARSRAVRIRLPAVTAKEIVPLSTEQLGALLDEIPGRYRAAILLAAASGLRQGELFGLEPEHVQDGAVRVVQQLTVTGPGGPVVSLPKSARSRRTVPLPDAVVEAVNAHVKAFPPRVRRMVDTTGGKARERDVRLLFATSTGGPVLRGPWSRILSRAVKRAGLPAGTSLHDLRHTYASLLIREGESVRTVQARLGHATAATTLAVYSHLWPDADESTKAAVAKHLGTLLP